MINKPFLLTTTLLYATSYASASPELSFGDAEPVESPGFALAASEPFLSQDGLLALYCGTERPSNDFPNGDFYIYQTKRPSLDDEWGAAEPLPVQINQGQSCSTSLSSDGRTLYYAHADSMGVVGALYQVTRDSQTSEWAIPKRMESPFNDSALNFSPYVSADGLELYFMSDRAPGRQNQWNTWVSRRDSTSSPWGTAELLPEDLNVLHAADGGHELSTDGRWMVWASDRDGEYDLWTAHRRTRTAPWEEPIRVPDEVDVGADVWPHLSVETSTLYFSTNHLGEDFRIWAAPVGSFPPLGDYNDNVELDVADLDQVTAGVQAGANDLRYDVNEDGQVTGDDRSFWVHDLKQTYFGDANLDGVFDSGDFVEIFQAGEYEDGIPDNSTWAEGDFSGDGDFTSVDFVVALQDGGYQIPRQLAVVPEPHSLTLVLLGLFAFRMPRRE